MSGVRSARRAILCWRWRGKTTITSRAIVCLLASRHFVEGQRERERESRSRSEKIGKTSCAFMKIAFWFASIPKSNAHLMILVLTRLSVLVFCSGDQISDAIRSCIRTWRSRAQMWHCWCSPHSWPRNASLNASRTWTVRHSSSISFWTLFTVFSGGFWGNLWQILRQPVSHLLSRSLYHTLNKPFSFLLLCFSRLVFMSFLFFIRTPFLSLISIVIASSSVPSWHRFSSCSSSPRPPFLLFQIPICQKIRNAALNSAPIDSSKPRSWLLRLWCTENREKILRLLTHFQLCERAKFSLHSAAMCEHFRFSLSLFLYIRLGRGGSKYDSFQRQQSEEKQICNYIFTTMTKLRFSEKEESRKEREQMNILFLGRGDLSGGHARLRGVRFAVELFVERCVIARSQLRLASDALNRKAEKKEETRVRKKQNKNKNNKKKNKNKQETKEERTKGKVERRISLTFKQVLCTDVLSTFTYSNRTEQANKQKKTKPCCVRRAASSGPIASPRPTKETSPSRQGTFSERIRERKQEGEENTLDQKPVPAGRPSRLIWKDCVPVIHTIDFYQMEANRTETRSRGF